MKWLICMCDTQTNSPACARRGGWAELEGRVEGAWERWIVSIRGFGQSVLGYLCKASPLTEIKRRFSRRYEISTLSRDRSENRSEYKAYRTCSGNCSKSYRSLSCRYG